MNIVIFLLDFMNSFLQGSLFAHFTEYCLNKENYNKNKVVKLSIANFIAIVMCDFLFSELAMGTVLMFVFMLIIEVLAYKKKFKEVVAANSIIYFALGALNLCTLIGILSVSEKIGITDFTYTILAVTYIPQFILSYMILFKSKYFEKIYKAIDREPTIAALQIILCLELTFLHTNVHNIKNTGDFIKDVSYMLFTTTYPIVLLIVASLSKKLKRSKILVRIMAEELPEESNKRVISRLTDENLDKEFIIELLNEANTLINKK